MLALASLLASVVAADRVAFFDTGARVGYTRAPAPHDVRVSFTLSLVQRNVEKIQSIALAVSTPGHPQYGQFLRQAEIDDLTAPEPAHLAAVTTWLRGAGVSFTVKRELVRVSTSVRAAAALLSTEFVTYVQPGRAALIRATDYSLPVRVADAVSTIYGLHGMPLPLRSGPVRSTAPIWFIGFASAFEL